ncbi:MAG: PAS domain-containing protein [Blastocatellia bacterium]
MARYGVAVVSSGVTLFVCLFLDHVFSGNLPLTLFVIPVAVSAWFGGLRPGLLATLLCGLASDYFLMRPHFSFFGLSTADFERLGLFLATSGLLCWLIETAHIARREVEARAREAEQRQSELEAQLAERERARAERERLIAELETEQARFKAIVEHIPAGILMAEAPNGRIVMGNPQVERILGHPAVLSPDIESYRDWLAYDVDGRRVEGRESVLARALQGEVVVGREILYHRGDGVKAWIRVSGTPIHDASGRIVGGVTLFTDIDEEKRARESLRVNQERLNLAQKAARIGSFEWNIQTNVNIWSEEIEAIYGLPPGSFGGSHEAWLERVHPEDRRRAEQDVYRAFVDGEFSSGWRTIWPNGAVHWLQAQGRVFFDEAGQPLRLVGVNMDVTERKRAEEDLRASERRLEIALDAAKLGSWHMDFGANEMTCSAACKANFGRAPDDNFTYKDLIETIHPDDRERALKAVEQTTRNREEYHDEFRIIWPDSSLHWIAARGRVEYGPDGQPLHFDGVTLDLTERQQMEESLRRQTEALREADRRKDDFLATLAHELRNPLAPIRNAVRILTLRGDDPAVVTQTNEVMDRQVQQMVRLVDDLLEVSRIGRGKINLQKAPVHLAEVVATAVETSRPLIEAHGHTLTVSLPDCAARVEADAARLAQVLSNLLNNAAKYTEDGGQIDLIAECVNEEVTLRVRDNGIGIAPEKLPRVFDMFAQIAGETDRSQGGLGIGLTLARRLVEMHGGKIEVRSAGLGKGSEFLVRLPALIEPLAESARNSVEDFSAPTANGSRRILIVDDNVDSAESMAVLLRLDGHEVRLAHDGLAAVEEACAFRPDVVFLDLDLPKLDGYEVARRLRPAMGGMTLVAMTGYGQEEDRRRTREAGFHSHLVKPVDFDLLEEMLSSLAPSQSRNERRRRSASH